MVDLTKIRSIVPGDIPALKQVIDRNELFPSQMLDGMVSDYFDNPETSDLWFTFEKEKPVAIAYVAPEKMTEGTWNLYLIAVAPDLQGKGIGRSIVQYVENTLRAKGERILLVETSGLDEFKRTRIFYDKCGYEQEARIRDFYQAGEDKIVFRKSLLNYNIG